MAKYCVYVMRRKLSGTVRKGWLVSYLLNGKTICYYKHQLSTNWKFNL